MTNSHKTGPKDVFGQLLSIVWLYVSVGFFGALLFGLINIYFPDVLEYDYGRSFARELRVPLAVLTVVFPFYLWLTSYLSKDLEKHSEKKEMKVRKWLLYFTVTATSIAIVIDLITVIYKFLDGDLTVQFILKVLSVLAIAGAVFTYYLWLIRKDTPPSKDSKMKWFIYGVIGFGIFFIVLGYFNAGSPFAARMQQLDERRVDDLIGIQSQITFYYQAKEKLPDNMNQLRDDIKGYAPPKDPETDEPYTYRKLGVLKFELCATFAASNKNDKSVSIEKPVPVRDPLGGLYNENWQHDEGLFCFERNIDPDLYPPLQR